MLTELSTVYLGLGKGLFKQESLQLGFELLNFADWPAANSRQMKWWNWKNIYTHTDSNRIRRKTCADNNRNM